MRALPIPPHWSERAIVVVREELPRSWFSDAELLAADAYRLQKRRDEFLLSRAAAKTLAVRLGLATEPANCTIGDRRIGDRHLSLSHSAPYAAAAIDAGPVGVDVQVVRPISQAAAHLFLTDDEIGAMQSAGIEDSMIHFWCAKEALWKRHAGRIETLRRVPLALQEVRGSGVAFKDVETVRIGDVVVALTLPIS